MFLIIFVVNNAVVDIFKHKSLPSELIGYNVAHGVLPALHLKLRLILLSAYIWFATKFHQIPLLPLACEVELQV